jgi:hypothetical protein
MTNYQVVYSGGKKLKDIVKNSEDGLFYFWDEAGIANGPFDSSKEARKALNAYVKEILMEEVE